MADPSTAFAAVQLLLSTLHRVSTIITNLKNAPARVQDLKRDCDFTRMLLRTIRCEDTNHDQTDARSPVNIQRLLRGTVRQLKSEVDELLQELEKLPKSESKIGRWMANGVVVWKGSYLDGMQQKIRAKQGHLHLVLQSQIHSHTLERRRTHEDITMLLGSMVLNRFHPEDSTVTDKRRASDPGYSLPATPQARERFIAAVTKNDNRGIRDFFRQRLDPNFQTNDEAQLYPLHIAARNGDLTTIGLLLLHRADIGCTSRNNSTPLMAALEHGQLNSALALIQHGPTTVAVKDNSQKTALHIAARKNSYVVVKVLLANGADPNAQNTSGYTPLIEAVLREDRELITHDTSVLSLLLDPEAHGLPSAKSADHTLACFKDQHTALHLAAANGYIEDVKLLMASSESQSTKSTRSCTSAGDALKRTPLWLAARNGHLDVVKLLLDFDSASASQNSQDPEAPSPLWALVLSKLDPAAMKAGLSLLIPSVDVNARNTNNSTLLHRAAFTGDSNLTTLLLNAGSNPQIQDNIGRYPLHYAALRGHETVLSLLLTTPQPPNLPPSPPPSPPPLPSPPSPLDKFPDPNPNPHYINHPDTQGLTPLMLAAGSPNHKPALPIIHLLTSRGATPHLRNSLGHTALYVAASQGNVLAAAYLLGKDGADLNAVDERGSTCLDVARRNMHGEMVEFLRGLGALEGVEP